MKDSPWGPNPDWGTPKGAKPPAPAAHDGSEKPACMAVAAPVVVGIGLALWKFWRR